MEKDEELKDTSYKSSSTTTEKIAPKTTTRENQEEVTETSVAAPSKESVQAAQQFYKDVYSDAYPAPTMAEIIGADPDKYYENRENQKKLNEFRRKEAQFYNGLSVIGDIAAAASGGNVFKRQKDTTAADAVKENQRLDDLTRAENVMYNQKLREAEAAKQAAYQKAISDWYDKNTTKVTRKTGGGYELKEEGGGKTSTTRKSVDKIDTSSSGKNGKKILFSGQDNKIISRDMTEKDYNAFKGYLDGYIRDVIKNQGKDSRLEKYLYDLGYLTYDIVKDPSDPSGQTAYKTYVIDTDALLTSGRTRLVGDELNDALTNAWRALYPNDRMMFTNNAGGSSSSKPSAYDFSSTQQSSNKPAAY